MSVIIDRFFRLLPESYERQYEGVSLGLEEFITLDVAPANLAEVEILAGYTLGDASLTNPESILDGLDFKATSPTQYTFSLVYVPKQLSQSNGGATPQVQVQFGTWYTDKVAEFDTVTQLPIQNTVGDAPSPLPVVSVPNDEIIFTRRQSSVDLTRNSKKGRINDTAFDLVGVSIPQYCGMLSDYRFQPVFDDVGGVTYDVTYAFKTNYKKNVTGDQIGFKIELLNAGFSFFSTLNDPTTKTKYENDDGSFPVDPVKINEDGTVPNVTPFYTEFVIHDTEDFSTWGLPTAWPY
jgi:hypothetical protein